MGIHNIPSKMTGGLNTYYVTETTQEDLGNGIVLVRNYSRTTKGVLIPEFNCIIASPNLLRASTKFTTFVRTMSKREEQWRDAGVRVH